MDIEHIKKLKHSFDTIISKYKFNEGTKTQELVDYIISKEKHSSVDLATHFNIEIDEANTLLGFFQKGIAFKERISKEK